MGHRYVQICINTVNFNNFGATGAIGNFFLQSPAILYRKYEFSLTNHVLDNDVVCSLPWHRMELGNSSSTYVVLQLPNTFMVEISSHDV